jgi:hypothetical protein
MSAEKLLPDAPNNLQSARLMVLSAPADVKKKDRADPVYRRTVDRLDSIGEPGMRGRSFLEAEK